MEARTTTTKNILRTIQSQQNKDKYADGIWANVTPKIVIALWRLRHVDKLHTFDRYVDEDNVRTLENQRD